MQFVSKWSLFLILEIRQQRKPPPKKTPPKLSSSSAMLFLIDILKTTKAPDELQNQKFLNNGRDYLSSHMGNKNFEHFCIISYAEVATWYHIKAADQRFGSTTLEHMDIGVSTSSFAVSTDRSLWLQSLLDGMSSGFAALMKNSTAA